MSCDPALAARFTPRQPLLGRYEVCTDPGRLEDVRAGGLEGGVPNAALTTLEPGTLVV